MRNIIFLIAALSSGQVFSVEKMTEVVSDVIEAPGMSANQIGDRALQCLQSASGNVADKVEPLRDGETVYAIVVTGVSRALIVDRVRSRLAVIGKDGRFKVAHTDIERFVEPTGSWRPVEKYLGSGYEPVKKGLEKRAALLAECVVRKPETPGGDNW